MRSDFLPSTIAVFDLIGESERWEFRDESDETYLLYRACNIIADKAYTELGRDRYESETWTIEYPLVEALRRAMYGQTDNYAAQKIAATLFNCGRADAKDSIFLHPWNRVVFCWREQALTALKIGELLRSAGFEQACEAESGLALDKLLNHPIPSRYTKWEILPALFGEHCLDFSVRDDTFCPEHDGLFRELSEKAVPPITLGIISQVLDEGEGMVEMQGPFDVAVQLGDGKTADMVLNSGIYEQLSSFWIVRYTFDGREYKFAAEALGTCLDIKAVITNFNKFMQMINHPQRAFQFIADSGGDGGYSNFILANSSTFPEVARELSIPLVEFEGT